MDSSPDAFYPYQPRFPLCAAFHSLGTGMVSGTYLSFPAFPAGPIHGYHPAPVPLCLNYTRIYLLAPRKVNEFLAAVANGFDGGYPQIPQPATARHVAAPGIDADFVNGGNRRGRRSCGMHKKPEFRLTHQNSSDILYAEEKVVRGRS
jgi:hypothetical protein